MTTKAYNPQINTSLKAATAVLEAISHPNPHASHDREVIKRINNHNISASKGWVGGIKYNDKGQQRLPKGQQR